MANKGEWVVHDFTYSHILIVLMAFVEISWFYDRHPAPLENRVLKLVKRPNYIISGECGTYCGHTIRCDKFDGCLSNHEMLTKLLIVCVHK